MSFNHGKMGDTLGAELQALRGMEATWLWFSGISGANTYFKDKINTVYSATVQAEADTALASNASLSDTSPGTGQPGAAGLAILAKSAHDQRLSSFESYFFAYMDAVLSTSNADKSAGSILYNYDPTLLANGQVSILSTAGRWAALSRQMTADSKNLKKNAVTVGTFTGDSGNIGTLASSGESGKDYTFAGGAVLTCTGDIVGAVQLSVVLNLTTPLISQRKGGSGASSASQIVADNPVTVGQAFTDGETGLGFTVSLGSIVTTGDNGGTPLFSVPVVTNPAEGDSAKGKHYISVKHILVGGAGPNWLISWYRSGTRSDTLDLVTSIQVTGESGTVACTMFGSSSTLTFTFSKANAFTVLPNLNDTLATVVFDIKSPRVGDVFRYVVTNDEAGVMATKIGRRYPVQLPNGAAASAEYADTKATSVPIT